MIEGLKFAAKGIINHKVRSFLTVLGVVIGITSVIILIGIMQGIRNEIISSYEKMGLNVIEVNIFDQSYGLKDSDIKSFIEKKSVFIGYSPSLSIYDKTVDYGSDKIVTTLKGVDVDYLKIMDLAMQEGRFLSFLDIRNNERVCVLGSLIASSLFNNGDTIGKEIKVNGEYYTVIGVMAEKADNEKGSEDDQIFISYTNAQRIQKTNKINNVYFLIKSRNYISDAMNDISLFLKSKISNDEFYSVYTKTSLMLSMMSVLEKFRIALLGVSSISLIVGGIGIMNIMFVNISERRKEIGIRLAVGAVPKDIMIQFLIEAITISCAGGIFGVTLGIVILFIIVTKMGISFVLSYTAVLLSVGISVMIGVVFGSVPAIKASKVDPIESLRL